MEQPISPKYQDRLYNLTEDILSALHKGEVTNGQANILIGIALSKDIKYAINSHVKDIQNKKEIPTKIIFLDYLRGSFKYG